MDIDFSRIDYLKNPSQEVLKDSAQQFLISLQAPTVIDIEGQDQTRSRVVVALLHGDEPSGFYAIHQWLTQYRQPQSKLMMPATNMRFIICSVEAAKTLPLFTNRNVINGEDLNRCFYSAEQANRDIGYQTRANLIANAIEEVTPEVIVDLHNSIGKGPAFAVTRENNDNLVALTSLFCSTLILSQINIGALVEQDFGCPNITIECGGASDESAHDIAYEGLQHLCGYDFIEDCHHNNPVEIIHTPLRLRIKPDSNLQFAHKNTEENGVVLIDEIEKLNYGVCERGQVFGWINENGLEHLELIDAEHEDVITDFFSVINNQLVCACNIRLFKATTELTTAQSDCLFYVIKQRDVKTANLVDVHFIAS